MTTMDVIPLPPGNFEEMMQAIQDAKTEHAKTATGAYRNEKYDSIHSLVTTAGKLEVMAAVQEMIELCQDRVDRAVDEAWERGSI